MKNIAVIFGGRSPEYEVSLQSAYAVISHMDREKFTPVLIGISRQGRWYRYRGSTGRIAEDKWCNEADCAPFRIDLSRPDGILGDEGMRMDAAFPILHGKNGEDGTVQGLFETAGVPIIGCGVLSSALCMDKDRAHKLVRAAGIAVPASCVLGKDAGERDALSFAEKIGYPLFVKPVRAGSSFGVAKVFEREDLSSAVNAAFAYDDRVILEESIEGFEVGCAVIGKEELTVGEADEIELSGGFFDYTEKYTLKTSAIHVPARIDSDTAGRVKETAKRIYKTLGCSGFARVDLFLTPSGGIVFNEVNTIPGFTAHSRFPNMLKAAGMSFEQIVTAVIETAV